MQTVPPTPRDERKIERQVRDFFEGGPAMAGLSPLLVFPVASGWILQLSVQCHFNLGAWGRDITLQSEGAVGAQALAWTEAEKVTDLQTVESAEPSGDMKQEVMHNLQ